MINGKSKSDSKKETNSNTQTKTKGHEEKMKKLMLIISVMMIAGCATASPIDWLVPTPSDTTMDAFLGDDSPNASLLPYHTLADTIAEKKAVDNKLVVYKAQGELAKGKASFVEAVYAPVSSGLWALLLALAASLGWVMPSPAEKHKVEAALNKPPPKA